MTKTALFTSGAVFLALAISGPAYAQQSGETNANDGRQLGEIVVTAQRREQSLQDAAIPMQAFDQDSLTQSGLESAQDLGQLSPAIGISAGGGPLTSVFVRGVGALTVNPLTDSAVAQNVDGVYLGRSSGMAGQALFDLERIELLKGPQGTLYGRNATGGVVNYIPVKPKLGENSGYLQGEFGNYSKVGVQGAVNFDIGDGKTAFRLSGNRLKRDGYSDDGTNDQDSFSLRAQVLIEPTDNLSVRVAADYSEINGTGPGGDLYGTYSNDTGSLTDFTPSGLEIDSGPSSDGANAIRAGVLHTPSFAPFRPIDGDNLFQDISFTGVMAEINYGIDAGTFTFIPAYRESDQDYAFSGPGFAPAVTKEENSQKSLELRFASDLEGPFNGIVGAFYIEEDISTSGIFAQNYATPMQNYDNGGESWAIFGQGTFDVSEAFRLNAGIRYTEDSKFVDGISDTFVTFCGGSPISGDFLTPGPPFVPNAFNHGCAVPGAIPAHPLVTNRDEFIQYFVDQGALAPGSVATVPGMGPPPVYNLTVPFPAGFPAGLAPPPFPGFPVPGRPAQLAAIVNVGDGALQQELDYNEVTYRIGAEYDWGPSNLLYATYETGYRAGGVDLSTASPTYDPEYIDAFTLGSKNRFLDNTLQVNAEAFLWKYDGQQVTYFTTLDSASAFPIANADATIKGVDLDVIWAATDNTTISGNVQILDSTYDDLQLISDPGRGRFGCDSTGVANNIESYDCSGNALLYSPDFGADLTINHIIDLAKFDLSLTGNVSHRAEQQTNFLFLDDTASGSYTTLNLDATLSTDDAGWSISAFMRNVTDERYLTNTSVSNRGLSYGVYNAPQTYGVRLRANF
ncbi:MAG: TonB-dependent receptor [Acidimicrobiales bacterium]|nr:TonB-dependent receptor [Hyphomonadaceae bacterium]RZV39721.1 MAG: TonB-dependent receptor [Acidimicrobiales bacterium]